MQDDYLLANLTVLENLEFAADMRLNLSSEEKMERVNKVIKDIGLTNCKSTRIGDSLLRGISGIYLNTFISIFLICFNRRRTKKMLYCCWAVE